MIDVPMRLHRQVPIVQDVQKTVDIHQDTVHQLSCRHLRGHAEVSGDGDDAQVQHNDKFIDAEHLKNASSPKVYRAESYIPSLIGIPEHLMQVPTTQEAQKTVEVH